MQEIIKSIWFMWTYESMLVGDVIGEFELMEWDTFLHPLFACARWVRVYVHPFGHLGIGLACDHPAGIVELVPAIVGGDDVHQEDVFGLLIQPRDADFERREHTSVKKKRKLKNKTKIRKRFSNKDKVLLVFADKVELSFKVWKSTTRAFVLFIN